MPSTDTAADAYLAACDATRKAWHRSPMLSRVRLKQIESAQAILRAGDAAAIADLVCDMSGPLHTGDRTLTGAAWQQSGVQLAKVVLTVIVAGLLSERRRASNGAPSFEVLCVEQLKSWIVHWIDSGVLPRAVSPPVPSGAAAGSTSEPCQAAMISDWLVEQASSGQAGPHPAKASRTSGGAPHRPDWQRLAVVAISAPSVEGLLVISRLDDAYLAVLRARDMDRPATAAVTDKFKAASGPMKRSAEDDSVADVAFQALVQQGDNSCPEAAVQSHPQSSNTRER